MIKVYSGSYFFGLAAFYYFGVTDVVDVLLKGATGTTSASFRASPSSLNGSAQFNDLPLAILGAATALFTLVAASRNSAKDKKLAGEASQKSMG